MEMVEFLVVSENFAREYSSQSDVADALTQLSRCAPSTIITLGERGLCWRNRADCRFGASAGTYPAFSITAEDTTGAGDAFHGRVRRRSFTGDGLGKIAAFRLSGGRALLHQKRRTPWHSHRCRGSRVSGAQLTCANDKKVDGT